MRSIVPILAALAAALSAAPSAAVAQSLPSPSFGALTLNGTRVTGIGTGSGTLAKGDDARILGACQAGGTNDCSGAMSTAVGGNTLRSGASRAADTFNVADYGAKCDGYTNDDAAINATLTAAYNSTSYQNNNAVKIEGPAGATQRGCVMNSANMTMFNKGSGGNPRPRVELANMTWLCTGAGNICLDAIGADIIKQHDFSIRGDNVNPPEIGIQVGTATGVSAAWHSFTKVNVNGNYSFAALYNVGSEANTYEDDFFVNTQGASGPIGGQLAAGLGAITGGTGYTAGTYTAVPLTGGSGNGAVATITVNASGLVTSVLITYEGRDYKPGDLLTASSAVLGSGGSGFGVLVAAVKNYAVVLDGVNHWRARSAFVPVTLPVDTWTSHTLNTFINANIRASGTGQGAFWTAGTGGLHMYNSYVLNYAGDSCFDLYNNNNQEWALHLEVNCEAASPSKLKYVFSLTGPTVVRNLHDFYWIGYHSATVAVFSTDPNITTVNATDFHVVEHYVSTVIPMFTSAGLWFGSGGAAVDKPEEWNAPASFQGSLAIGNLATPPGLGPVDILPGSAGAGSVARLINRSYTGPLIQAQRASDGATADIYPNAFGDLDKAVTAVFCASTTCGVSKLYDQSGNGNNYTQTTAALQPALSLTTTGLGGRPSMTWGTTTSMQAPSSASVDNLWAAGGYATFAGLQNTNAQPNRLLSKVNTYGGWELRANAGASTPLTFVVGSSNGQWVDNNTLSSAAHVYDVQYSSASLSNNPALGVDGNAQPLTATAPTTAISSDAGVPLLLGNNANSASATRGFVGSIAEVVLWKTTPTAAQQEAVRRNQAAYYGVGGVQ